MSKIKFIVSESEFLNHEDLTTKYLLTFQILEQDMNHSEKIHEYTTANGTHIKYAYPYICYFKKNGYIYLRSNSVKGVENKNKITSDSFDSKVERTIYRNKLIDALKEWSEKN